MDEEEEQRRSVNDFISSLPIYIYIYIYISLCLLDAYKKNERSLLPKRKEEDQYHHHHFLCFVSQRNDAPFSSIDFTIGNNLTAYTNELDL